MDGLVSSHEVRIGEEVPYKGRVVLRGDIVKHDSKNYAVCTEQSASASHMTAAKVLDVISGLPGCSGQASDAVSAYTQVEMKTHQNFFIFRKRMVQRFGSYHRKQEDHSIGTKLTIQQCHWRAIFTVIHRLDSSGRQHMRKFRLEKDGRKFSDGSACTFIANCNYSCQCMLTTKRWQKKLRTCRRCGHICKKKSIWTIQYHSLIWYILDLLSEQHKSTTQLWWNNGNCSRSWSAQIQMSKLRRKIRKTSELAHKTIDQPHKKPHILRTITKIKPEDSEMVGELEETCSQIVLTFPFLARIRRPDLPWTENDLTKKVAKWHPACDLRLARLISYIYHTTDYRQCCHAGNQTIDCKLGLFQDADFAGNMTDPKSTSSGVLCIFGSHTLVPISWTCEKQTAVSHSSTEAEIMSLDAGLRMKGIPAMSLWDTIIEILHPQAGSDSKLVHQTQIQKHHEPFRDIDYESPNARLFSMRTSLYIFEQRQTSHNSSCITHTSCWFGSVSWPHQFRSNDQIKYVNTTQQLTDILTKGSFIRDRWTQLTLQVNIMTHTTFTQSDVSVSSAVVNPSFSSMGKRAGESFATSASAKQKPVHCTAMIARQMNDKSADTAHHAVSTRLQAWRPVSARFSKNNTTTATGAPGQGWTIMKLQATGCCWRSVKHWRKESSSSIKHWWMILQRTSRHSKEEQAFYSWNRKDPKLLQYFPLNVAIWSQFTSDCLWASFWLTQGHEDFKRMVMNESFPRTPDLIQSAQPQVKNTEQTQRCIQ